MMQQHTIHIAGGVVRNPLVRLTEPVTLDFLAGEHIAIVGPNGAGKSLLVDMLTEKYPLRDGELTYDFSPSLTKTAYDNIKYIAFRDTYGSADANYYYQQRWNAHDQEDAPLVREVLGEVKDDILRRQLFELFSIEPMLDKKIILLSSGELRRFQLTKALLTVPRILIMDITVHHCLIKTDNRHPKSSVPVPLSEEFLSYQPQIRSAFSASDRDLHHSPYRNNM